MSLSLEHGLSREQIIGELSKSLHGKLAEYSPIISGAARKDPEFLAHLIAWDFTNGQIKDTKIALPVLTLAEKEFPSELLENSLAHLALQPPRELLKAVLFAIQFKEYHGGLVHVTSKRQARLEKMVRAYLRKKEAEPGKWARLAVRHRRSLKSLYKLSHSGMPDWAKILFREGVRAPGSIFADIANLSRMEPAQAAAAIQKWHLSPLVVSGAMTGSKKAQESSAVVQATMEQMSDTELITRAPSLERKGVARDMTLKETFRKKVSKATKSNKATLKTGHKADEVEDESMKTMLKELQERQIQAQKDSGRGIDGNWLVIADKSSSMEAGVELAKHVAGAIAKFVTGRVWLVFCNEMPAGAEVTGLTLDQIKLNTKFVRADGWTSMGVGIAWANQNRLNVDGVVVVSDGGENRAPMFADELLVMRKRLDKDIPAYYYKVQPGSASYNHVDTISGGMRMRGIAFTEFDLTHGKVDYFSIPNLVQQMNANRFSVVDKIMACPLLTFEGIGLEVGKMGKKVVSA
jgi:hypothetical protein